LLTLFIKTEERRLEGVRLDEVQTREVFFKNEEQDIKLAGLLFVPKGEGPFPAAVIIHGSGTSYRENSWYLTLCRYLQSNGILVLLPDKRGSVKSEGSWQTASFDDLTTDTKAAVHFLTEQKEIPIASKGVVGMSQGGQIAPMAAVQSAEIDFVVSIVSGAVPMHEQFHYEENHNLRQMGILPGISNLLAHATTFYHRNLGHNKSFWKAVGNFNSLDYWKEVNVNSLIIYGKEDTNVPVAKSVGRLKALNKPNLIIRTYENSGHALESPEGKGNSILRKDALAEITRFIHSMEI
ncbi:MAG: alpha/beta hydrolase family protein, partial [Mariniphaga sp.]